MAISGFQVAIRLRTDNGTFTIECNGGPCSSLSAVGARVGAALDTEIRNLRIIDEPAPAQPPAPQPIARTAAKDERKGGKS